MKIIHSDRDESPAIELPADEFLKKNAEINAAKSAKDVVIDLNTGQPIPNEKPVAEPKSKAWLWVVILIVLIIIATIAYNYIQKRNQQTNG